MAKAVTEGGQIFAPARRVEIRNATARAMDQATLAAVMAGQPVTRQEVFAPEFVAGAGI